MIGRTLAHYEIVEKLGQGGMGEVYLARDTRLGRDVAIKLMPADLARDPARRTRFEREAQAIAALNHPNVVTIYAVEEAEGLLFLVMERVVGVTLTRKIPAAGLPLRDFFNLALPFCEAVAAAHTAGITHRDLKPENVMVDNTGRVKVLDFGLAKLIDDASVGSDATVAEQTREGVILGTAAYMSPEQAEGKLVDPRSDVFTMGILLYEMLTGQRPFQGDTHMSTLTAVIRDDPRPVFELRPELPREFARVVRRCLEKHPDRRYESARGVRYDLEILREELISGEHRGATPVATVAGAGGYPSMGSQPSMSGPSAAPLDPMLAASQPSLSSTPPASQSMPPAPQHSSNRIRIFGVVAILAVVAIAWWQWPRDSSSPATDPVAVDHSSKAPIIVVFPFENLGPPDDEYFAAGITDEITTRLTSVKGLRVLSRTSATQYDREGKNLAQVAEERGVDYVLEGAVRWQRSATGPSRVRVTPQLVGTEAGVQVWAESYDRSMEEIFSVQAEIAGAVVTELGVALGSPASSAEEGMQLTGDLDAYHAYLRASNTLTHLGVLEPAEMETCIALLNNAVTADPKFAEAFGLLARAHAGMVHYGWDQTQDRVDLARVAMERAMELKPDNVQVQLGRGFYFYHGLKEYAHAREAFERASELQPGNTEIMVAVGYVLRRENRVADAVGWFERALEFSPNDTSMLYDLGETLTLLRRYDEGLLYLMEAVRRSPDAPRMYSAAAWTMTLSGDGDGAQALMDKYPGEPSVELNLIRIGVAMARRDYPRALEVLASCPESHVSQFNIFAREVRRAAVLDAMGVDDRVAETAQLGLRMLERQQAVYPDHSNLTAAIAVAKSYLGPEAAANAVAEVRRSLELYPASQDSWMRTWRVADLGVVLIRAGQYEEAVGEIRDLLAQSTNAISVGLLRSSPVYDPLRGRVDFEALLRD